MNFAFDRTDIDDIEFGAHPCGKGVQALVTFPNGYGASIIGGEFGQGFYGNGETSFELAVMRVQGDSLNVASDTPITNDVLGWLSREEVTQTLERIRNLS